MGSLLVPPLFRPWAHEDTQSGARPLGLWPTAMPAPVAVEFDDVWFQWDDHIVLRGISFTVPKGSMRMLLGASGSGKSTILKIILGLIRPDAGHVLVNGEPIDGLAERDLLRVRADIGMLFQEGALFDSLTVAENVGYRLAEETRMADEELDRRVEDVLGFVGLRDYRDRLPAELSGGQRRRVGIARAMAAKPGLLLFDDPTTGLDPILATTVNDEIVKLRDLEQVTSIIVTHQLRDAFYVATHQAVRKDGRVEIVKTGEAARADFMLLHDGTIAFEGNATELLASRDDYLQRYLYNTLPPW